jgi:5'-nucleotidase
MMVRVGDLGVQIQECLNAFPPPSPLLTSLLLPSRSVFLFNGVVAQSGGDQLLVIDASQARNMARAEGARVFVVIAHLGVTDIDPTTKAATGPLIDFAKNVTGFDVIFGDHTNEQFSDTINGALVVENLSKGATYAKVNVTIDRSTGVVSTRTNTFVEPVTSGVTPDPAVEQVLAGYRTQLAQQLDGKIGVATDVFPRVSNVERLKEVALDNLIADAFRARYNTQLAIQNGGSIRSALPSSYTPQDKTLRRPTPGYQPGPPYDIVAGDIYSVLPFGNTVVTRTVTGTQLYAALENSVSALPGASGRFLQVSGFSFTYDVSRPVGSRIVSVTLDSGAPLAKDATTYTLALTDFTNAGGDEYTMFADGQGVSRELDAQVVLDYVKQLGTITPTTGTASAQWAATEDGLSHEEPLKRVKRRSAPAQGASLWAELGRGLAQGGLRSSPLTVEETQGRDPASSQTPVAWGCCPE